MVRRIIQIDDDKCNGCGVCANACHEGAIGMVDGKAKLLREDYCDGLGDCLPNCPAGAITFVEREAAAYDEQAVLKNKAKQSDRVVHKGCPGQKLQQFHRGTDKEETQPAMQRSQLAQWPCQIKLAPLNAPYFDGAKLLIAADCTAYAYAGMHGEFMKGKVTLIGCPKLDNVDYSEKLTKIIRDNNICSVTLVRMQVPCCGGLKLAVEKALRNSMKSLPLQVVTISTDGRILEWLQNGEFNMENTDGIYRSYPDRIVGALIGLARACENNPKTENTDTVITEALAACIPETGISDETFCRILDRIQKEKNAVAPHCAVCKDPCGNTAAYDMKQIWDEKREDRRIKLRLLSESCKAAEDICKGEVSAIEKEKYCALFYKILPMVSYGLEAESYLALMSEMNQIKEL